MYRDILELIAREIPNSGTWVSFSQINKTCYHLTQTLLRKHRPKHMHDNSWYFHTLPIGILHGEAALFDARDKLVQKHYFWNHKSHGKMITYSYFFGVQNVSSEKQFHYGKLHTVLTWYQSEPTQLESELHYVDDKLEGLQKYWYSNGQLKSIVNYVNGKEAGIRINYNRMGHTTLSVRGDHKLHRGLITF